jgi:hypothetical protein
MMNLFLSIKPEQGIMSVLGIVWFVIAIIMIVKFFGMAKDLKNISRNLTEILSLLKDKDI